MYDRVVRGGRAYISGTWIEAEIGIKDGRFAAVAQAGERLPAHDLVEADGLLVIPGPIDPHMHIRTFNAHADDFHQASISAAHGGITTVIPFVRGTPSMPVAEFLDHFIAEGNETAVLDFALHCGVQSAVVDQIPEAFKRGVATIKLHMDYKRRGLMLRDDQFLLACELTAEGRGMAMTHAENGDLIDRLEQRLMAQGKRGLAQYLESRPNIAEAEAIHRGLVLAELAGCPLYVVHLSTKEGLQEIIRARAAGKEVYTETCPQYLTLTDEDMQRAGPGLIVGPPLRSKADNEAIWWGIRQGIIPIIGSDHYPYELQRKLFTEFDRKPVDDVFETPVGMPCVETMLSLIYSEGVVKGRISAGHWVRLFTENTARQFGLADRKGSIRVGADADLVLFDPQARWVARAADMHTNGDYCAWEGWELTGRPIYSMVRGTTVLEDGEVKVAPTHGRFLARGPVALER